MSYKADWYKDASYSYTTPPRNQNTEIDFFFPNATNGGLKFTTWLYKHGDEGQITEKNLAAEMLQCYIDRDLLGK